MPQPLRIGVIGLGRRWRQRYKPALVALPQRYHVEAVCDQVQERAEREAASLGCRAAAGPMAVLERPELDAIFLVDPQWFGLWPLEAAAARGKPVFCAVSPALDDAHADALVERIAAQRLPVMVELAHREAPALVRARELLTLALGPARCLLGEISEARSSRAPSLSRHLLSAASSILGPRSNSLLDGCLSLVDGEPARIWAASSATAGVFTLILELDDGRRIQINRVVTPTSRAHLRLHLVTESGSITLWLPRLVTWRAPDGSHRHVLPAETFPARAALTRFYDGVRESKDLRPSLQDAHRLLRLLRAADASQRDGTWVSLTQK
jgi:predicted dehydrogenase